MDVMMFCMKRIQDFYEYLINIAINENIKNLY